MVRNGFFLIALLGLALATPACGKGKVNNASIVPRQPATPGSDKVEFSDANSEGGSGATLNTPSFRLSGSSLGGSIQKNTAVSTSFRVTGGVYGF